VYTKALEAQLLELFSPVCTFANVTYSLRLLGVLMNVYIIRFHYPCHDVIVFLVACFYKAAVIASDDSGPYVKIDV